ncbi:MAG TPA: 6-carboxytetrahydropterin synthase [Xanthobacteraceae bacterium]|jgi:6-pyruvoyltetrahydropterin/6-carboxytetrahydropterin synthase|nr:6-carboxytetrahydropterin synthase [Xanthobacteraceae bacterium]
MSNENAKSIAIVQRLEWDAMHRIPGHEGVCKAYHGHRYAAEISVTAEKLDALGRVVDFSVIEDAVGGWIKLHFDHTAILYTKDDEPSVKAVIEANKRLGRPAYLLEGYPTVENIAAELGRVSAELLAPHGVRVISIRLWETPQSSALWTAK